MGAEIGFREDDAGIESRTVYRRFIGPDGKPAMEKYRLHGIDAREAVRSHPKEYSFTPWSDVKPDAVVDKIPPPLEIKPEMLTESQFTPMVERPPGVIGYTIGNPMGKRH
jgi:hypothetical protein